MRIRAELWGNLLNLKEKVEYLKSKDDLQARIKDLMEELHTKEKLLNEREAKSKIFTEEIKTLQEQYLKSKDDLQAKIQELKKELNTQKQLLTEREA